MVILILLGMGIQIGYEDYVKAGSYTAAKEKGLVRLAFITKIGINNLNF